MSRLDYRRMRMARLATYRMALAASVANARECRTVDAWGYWLHRQRTLRAAITALTHGRVRYA